jgi:prepilin-type N-terminal cleavage/methylation domain-containing protein
MSTSTSVMAGVSMTSMLNLSSKAAARVRRGFSLIEILVSILILALGLLGLGAVFPVVIREQRLASDNISGTIAGNNVRAVLRAAFQDQAEIVYKQLSDTEYEVEYRGLAALLAGGYEPLRNPDNSNQIPYRAQNYSRGFSQGNRLGLWMTNWNWTQPGGSIGSSAGGMAPNELDRGVLRIANEGTVQFANTPYVNLPDVKQWELPVQLQPQASRSGANQMPAGTTGKRRITNFAPIGLAERLNPGSVSTDETPSLVWDFVARRVPRGEFDVEARVVRPSINDDLQAVVFVRRVDTGIRAPLGESVRQAMLGAQRPATIMPVGCDLEGRATLDGTDGQGGVRYSWPLQTNARDQQTDGTVDQSVFDFYDIDGNNPNENKTEFASWLLNVDVSTVEGEAMAQIGQKLIDNLGNVYTVDRIENDPDGAAGSKRIRLTPPPAAENVRLENVGTDGGRQRKIKQFIFTAQVPVAAFVVDVPVKRENAQ